jgi:hypothetical protein
MILVFVIVIMLLISLMGVIIMVLTRAEISISGHYRLSQEAFNSTDSSAKLTILLGRVLIHPVLGNPRDFVAENSGQKPQYPMTVEINSSRFSLDKLIAESNPYGYQKRYLESSLIKGSTAQKPHLTFKVGDKVVATASISLDTEISPRGFSLAGADRYDPVGGANVPVDLIMTVTGTTPLDPNAKDPHAPRSILTTITRELM